MNDDFFNSMRLATVATRALNPAEATRVIRDALAGNPASTNGASREPEIKPASSRDRPKPFIVDRNAEIIEPEAGTATGSIHPTKPRLRTSLADTVRILREGNAHAGAPANWSAGNGLAAGVVKGSLTPAVPAGAQFLSRSFTCEAGGRSYKLYIPASATGQARGLIVMLHGCKQNPDDFAAGTRMNDVAEEYSMIVAYPHQTAGDNTSSCWNWFRPSDQHRDTGEPSIIAGITAALMTEFGLDRSRVFVAGLSAGGAMAAVMAKTYPDLYSAAGVHSGLAYRSANDVMSAFAVMRGEGSKLPLGKVSDDITIRVRTIVFHGSRDRTVHPVNADRIVAAAKQPGDVSTLQILGGASAGGRASQRTIVANPAGMTMLEFWLVDDVGHAWCGGDPRGSYTDRQGPDASREMVRFFLEGLD